MKSLTYVEIDINYCSLIYGTAPCTAELGVTGDIKCFNTRNITNDCQDSANFTPSVLTLRWTIAADYLPADIPAIPSVKSVSIAPGVIKPGESLGQRESVTITFTDHPHSDAGIDKYAAERGYDPFRLGTFFGKFRARNPYLKGQPIRVIQGFLGDTLEEMETRHYIVETTSGPDVSGRFTVKAKDALKLLDKERAQAPQISRGYLSAAIDTSETAITLEPAGIGNLDYPTSGIAAIGDEAVTFTRSGDAVTLVRGQLGTDATEHDDEDLFQLGIEYDPSDVASIIYDLIVNYSDTPASYMNLSEWQLETVNTLNVLYSGRILQPTAVVSLINELIEQAGLVVWFDTIEQQIRLRVLRGVSQAGEIIDEDNFLQGTLTVTEQPDKRVSEVWTYYNQKSPLEKLDDVKNYKSGLLTLLPEDPYNQTAIKKVFSRWIPPFGQAVASRLNAILLSRYNTPPRVFDFSLFRTYEIVEGQGVRLQARTLQDATGAEITVPAQVVSINRQWDRNVVRAEELLFTEVDGLEGAHLIVIDADSYNLNLRTIHDQIYPTIEEFDEVIVLIQPGIKIGSLSPSLIALDIGSWPANVTITITNRGSILGHGGLIRQGGAITAIGATWGATWYAGGPGGGALYTRYAIDMDNQGTIASGGGAGGDSAPRNSTPGGYPPAPGGSAGGGPGAGRQTGAFVPGGSAATETTGGAGGTFDTMTGGAGGNRGQNGNTGQSSLIGGGAPGGAAGNAVDGESFVTYTAAGTIIGPRVN